MRRLFPYLGAILVAIFPVFLTWALGYWKAPDSVDLVDYSSSGTELINSQEKLTSSLKIQANDKSVEKLSIYNVHFINRSSKNLKNIQIEFKIKSALGSELVASAIKGPENYSESLIKKIGESKSSATYTIAFMNVVKKRSSDYFTASFLFSGQPPDSIIPVSLSPNVEFIDAKNNSKADVIAIIGVVLIVFVEVIFIWWLIYRGNKEGRIRREQFEDSIGTYLSLRFRLPLGQAEHGAKEIAILKDIIFKPEGRLKKWIKSWLST